MNDNLTDYIPFCFRASCASDVYTGKFAPVYINGNYRLVTGAFDKRRVSGFRIKTVLESKDRERFCELVRDYFKGLML